MGGGHASRAHAIEVEEIRRRDQLMRRIAATTLIRHLQELILQDSITVTSMLERAGYTTALYSLGLEGKTYLLHHVDYSLERGASEG
jgi:hypothetical protein